MGTSAANGVVVNQAAITQSIYDLNDTVAELRMASTQVPVWGAGGQAGRAHSDRGQRIASGFDRVTGWLHRWATATDFTAGAIGKATVELVRVDHDTAREQQKLAVQLAGH